MNLTHDLEQFQEGLSVILNLTEILKNKYPEMFQEVLPDGEELRLQDALTAIQNAHEQVAISLDLIGTDLIVD